MIKTTTISNVSKVPSTTLHHWCKRGVVTPLNQGRPGVGGAKLVSFMQAIGIMVAARLHQSERGCAMVYVKSVVDSFNAISEDELIKSFNLKKTHFVMPHQGKPILAGGGYDRVDVMECYQELKAAVGEQPKCEVGQGEGEEE